MQNFYPNGTVNTNPWTMTMNYPNVSIYNPNGTPMTSTDIPTYVTTNAQTEEHYTPIVFYSKYRSYKKPTEQHAYHFESTPSEETDPHAAIWHDIWYVQLDKAIVENNKTEKYNISDGPKWVMKVLIS